MLYSWGRWVIVPLHRGGGKRGEGRGGVAGRYGDAESSKG